MKAKKISFCFRATMTCRLKQCEAGFCLVFFELIVPLLRKECPFGVSCYRRNQKHLREFSHPAKDGGALKVEDRPSATAPERASTQVVIIPVCKHGAGCYRKNPQHRKDFAHPAGNFQPVNSSLSDLSFIFWQRCEDKPFALHWIILHFLCLRFSSG